jgi:sigma-E factor negative regulatory protein RseA
MEPTMNNEPPVDGGDGRWLLSAMADGEADEAELARGLAAWAGADPQQRLSWHAYHLIGDVLRSEDLASPPGRDGDFLQRLRARLDEEPAVLAPQPLPAAVAAKRHRSWLLPVALAAGVMGLASALVLSVGQPEGAAPASLLAQAPAATPVAAAASVAPAAAPAEVAEPVPPGGRVVRDARLDSYLRAHRDYAAAWPGSLPGGSGRSISTVSLER